MSKASTDNNASVKKVQKKENPHKDHRKRVRQQMLKNGIEHLLPHEALEILLYYSIPQGNTNPIAHALIKKFGSISGVLNADFDKLLEVKGVGPETATLIRFTQMFSKRYASEQCPIELAELFTSEKLKEYCRTLFLGAKEEEIRCIYLTDDLKLISQELICVGKIGTVEIPVRRIAKSAFDHNCSNLVLSHNHPVGTCMPSRADLDSTRELVEIYSKVDVKLIDHIIVGRDDVLSMKESGFLTD